MKKIWMVVCFLFISLVVFKLFEPIYPEKHIIPSNYQGPLFIEYMNEQDSLEEDTLMIRYNLNGAAQLGLKRNWNFLRFPKRKFIQGEKILTYIEEAKSIDSNQIYVYRNFILSGKFKGENYIQVYLISSPNNFQQNYSAFLKARGGL